MVGAQHTISSDEGLWKRMKCLLLGHKWIYYYPEQARNDQPFRRTCRSCGRHEILNVKRTYRQ